MSNKGFIIQHAKVLCLCGRISRMSIYGECVTEVCEAERNWRGKSSQMIGQQQTNLSNRSSGVQIPRDICTRLGCYLYSTRYSWIIKYFSRANNGLSGEKNVWRSDLLPPSASTIGILSTLTYTEFDCVALLAML